MISSGFLRTLGRFGQISAGGISLSLNEEKLSLLCKTHVSHLTSTWHFRIFLLVHVRVLSFAFDKVTCRGANTRLFSSRNRQLLSTTRFSILVRARRRLLRARPRVLYIGPLSLSLSLSCALRVSPAGSPPGRTLLKLVFGVNDASWTSLLADQRREESPGGGMRRIARSDRLARGNRGKTSSRSSNAVIHLFLLRHVGKRGAGRRNRLDLLVTSMRDLFSRPRHSSRPRVQARISSVRS